MLPRNAPLPYSVEYSKSDFSNCKKCRKGFQPNALRMSLNQPCAFFNGGLDTWFHYDCFWQHLVRGRDDINITSISNVDWLRWEDQQDLREKIRQFREPHFLMVPQRSTVFLSQLKTEKSASNRGKCGKCCGYFKKDEIKVVHKGKNLHFKCHLENFDVIKQTLDIVPGWMSYEECWRNNVLETCADIINAKSSEVPVVSPGTSNDQGRTEEIVIEPSSEQSSMAVLNDLPIILSDSPDYPSEEPLPSSTSNKRATPCVVEIQESGESDAAKRRKLARKAKMAELLKARMKKQADHLFLCRQFFDKLGYMDMMAVLAANDQDVPEGPNRSSEMIDRLTDIATFGTPIVCSKCPTGKIIYNSARRTYVCTGYATEYLKCTFESKNPTRTPFVPTSRLSKLCQEEKFSINVMTERLYVEEEETEDVVKMDRRKSKGGVRGEQFIYAAEAFDSMNNVPVTVSAMTSTNTHIIKCGTVVDAKFPYASRCHVYKNEVDGSLYQATLSFTDLAQNKNSYHKIQLLKDDSSDVFYVFQSWGRVGTEVGGTSTDSYPKERAIHRFESIFNDKTKNKWTYRKHFRKMPGAFNYVETDFSEFAQLGEQDIPPGSKTLLPKAVKEIVMSIFDIENMKSALKSFEMDVNKMPLGRLSRNQINQAFSVLNELSDILIGYPVDNDRILACTNKFYTIIPHNFGMKVPEQIDTFHKIKEKNNMLNALLEIKFAYDQICGGPSNESTISIGMDPVDVNYQKLKCAMTPVVRDSWDWHMVQEYINNTKGSTHKIKVELMDILMLNRENESSKFKSNIGNRRLLWHGSGRMNFAGILGQGLRIAPPEAPVSGYMFGKGVYFADMFSKSFNYCRASAREEAYVLLCDVALGVMCTQTNACSFTKNTLPQGMSSVQGIGRECPHPDGNYMHPDGYLIPKGPKYMQGVNTVGGLLYNEYIVYDVDQIQLKYLVRVKVHSTNNAY